MADINDPLGIIQTHRALMRDGSAFIATKDIREGEPVTFVRGADMSNNNPFNTIHFAPVAGVQIYEQMAIRNQLGPYHLLLAHDILARKERYASVFQNRSIHDVQKRREGFVTILDNSVVELKEPIVDIDKVKQAARIVHANVIVLPDIYEDAQATVDSCKLAIDVWEKELNEYLFGNQYTFMMVPQGKTKEEFAWCAEQFADDKRIGWWGIPRNIVKLHGTREYGLQICRMLNPTRQIHMLGFSDDIIDDVMVCRRFLPQGIDSAVPIRAATQGREFSLDLSKLGPRPEGWLENAFYLDDMNTNRMKVERYLNS